MGEDQQALDLFNAAGEQVCSLGPNSNLRLGGHGSDGDILLYPDGTLDNSGETFISHLVELRDRLLKGLSEIEEIYVNGTSNSLPVDVQQELLRSIPGLEDCAIIRPCFCWVRSVRRWL